MPLKNLDNIIYTSRHHLPLSIHKHLAAILSIPNINSNQNRFRTKLNTIKLCTVDCTSVHSVGLAYEEVSLEKIMKKKGFRKRKTKGAYKVCSKKIV